MNTNYLENNHLILVGKVTSDKAFSHEIYGEKFYIFNLEVPRLSGNADIIPITVSERLLSINDLAIDSKITVEGQFRSYNSYETTAANKLVVSMRLQQISSGFIVGQKSVEDILNDVEDIDNIDLLPTEVIWLGDSCPKLDALMRDIAELDKPLLVLTHYSAEAAKIYELCQSAGYRSGLFTGWKVIGGIDAFKDGQIDVLVANSAKISRGFNLQIAHTTLFYSNTFSMETRQQAEFRTFRMGQNHACLYIDYSAADVDDTVIESLQMKKGLLEYIRGKDIMEVV